MNFNDIKNNNLQMIQHLNTGENEGILYLDRTLKEYVVVPNEVNPSIEVQLDLITFASEITAKLQGISHQAQLSMSNLM